jgi:hypothetical protein
VSLLFVSDCVCFTKPDSNFCCRARVPVKDVWYYWRRMDPSYMGGIPLLEDCGDDTKLTSSLLYGCWRFSFYLLTWWKQLRPFYRLADYLSESTNIEKRTEPIYERRYEQKLGFRVVPRGMSVPQCPFVYHHMGLILATAYTCPHTHLGMLLDPRTSQQFKSKANQNGQRCENVNVLLWLDLTVWSKCARNRGWPLH